MSIQKVKEFFKKYGMEERVLEFNSSSATVELAAQTLGCNPARIALDEKIIDDKRSRKLSDPELIEISDKFMSVAGLS